MRTIMITMTRTSTRTSMYKGDHSTYQEYRFQDDSIRDDFFYLRMPILCKLQWNNATKNDWIMQFIVCFRRKSTTSQFSRMNFSWTFDQMLVRISFWRDRPVLNDFNATPFNFSLSVVLLLGMCKSLWDEHFASSFYYLFF